MSDHVPFDRSLTSRSMVPPDPYYYRTYDSRIIKFYDYGAQILAWQHVYNALRSADGDARSHDSNETIGWWEGEYASARVRLVLHPGLDMTWGDWRQAIKGIAEFVTHFQFLDLDFDIFDAVQPISIGTGILTVV